MNHNSPLHTLHNVAKREKMSFSFLQTHRWYDNGNKRW